MKRNLSSTRGFKDALRTAILVGGSAGAFAAFGSPALSIYSPGPVPLLILAAVLLAVRPDFSWKNCSPLARWGIVALGIALLLPLAGIAGLVPQKEAALLSAPRWAFLIGVLVLGVAMRASPPAVVCCTFVAIAALRIWGAWQSGLDWTTEATWWIPCMVWLAGVAVVLRATNGKRLSDSAPLMAAVTWFVLVLVTMTIQESRHPTPHFFAKDRGAMIAALAEEPILGWGWGGAERVFQETARRNPAEDALAARAALRYVVEAGLLSALLLVLGGSLVLIGQLQNDSWTMGRIITLGIAGFLLMAVISSRGDWSAQLALFAFAFAATFAPNADQHPVERLRWIPSLVGALPAAVIALLFISARMHYESQQPRETLGATSILPTWTQPLRDQAFLVRDRPEQAIQHGDQSEQLEALASRWIDASPHDEFGWVEYVRVMHIAHGPDRSLPAVREATRRLPWSDPLAAWHRRILSEENRLAEALEFLEQLRERRGGSLPPALHARMAQLRHQLRESPPNGD